MGSKNSKTALCLLILSPGEKQACLFIYLARNFRQRCLCDFYIAATSTFYKIAPTAPHET